MTEDERIEFYDIEADEEVSFAVLAETTLHGRTFLLVTHPIAGEDEEEALILEATEDDGEDTTYETVDDEQLLDSLAKIFEELLEDTALM